jgi:hypothetical protein
MTTLRMTMKKRREKSKTIPSGMNLMKSRTRRKMILKSKSKRASAWMRRTKWRRTPS